MGDSERPQEADADKRHGDVRLEKVERLREAIANGTYSVSAEALAEKMMEHMRDTSAPSEEIDKSK